MSNNCYNFQIELLQQQCFGVLVTVFKNEALYQMTVSRWYRDFKLGRVSLSDDLREVDQKMAVTQENVHAVRNLIKDDRYVLYRKIIIEDF